MRCLPLAVTATAAAATTAAAVTQVVALRHGRRLVGTLFVRVCRTGLRFHYAFTTWQVPSSAQLSNCQPAD